jgi:hypothetical protein
MPPVMFGSVFIHPTWYIYIYILICVYVYIYHPPLMKRGNGKSPINGGFNCKIIYK